MSTPPIDLDPREVLEHLRVLGYNHITKDQLKQFIKDLKKLIKHDLRKLQAEKEISQENRPEHDSTCESSLFKEKSRSCKPVHGQRRVLRERNHAEKPLMECRSKSIAVQTLDLPPCNPIGSSRGASAPLDPPQLRDPSALSDITSSSCCSTCMAGTCSCSAPNLKKKPESKKSNSAPKPVSSFIRVAPSEVRMGKNDPVTLYHYYQSLWAKQNRPGENPHADVRWRIRHKMMAPAALKTAGSLENKRDNPPWVD